MAGDGSAAKFNARLYYVVRDLVLHETLFGFAMVFLCRVVLEICSVLLTTL